MTETGFVPRITKNMSLERHCFEQGVPWHSGIHRMYIHSETHMWHDNDGHTVRIKKIFLDIL